MKPKFPENLTRESLALWLIHSIAEEFHESAIIKGGMALQLLSCQRTTNDLDYVFIPFSSKRDILPLLEKVVQSIPDGRITKSMNTKSLRINIKVKSIQFQIEANVALECKSMPISTDVLAIKQNEMGKIVRIMDINSALSHKLAAWNERRLFRDLYDVYFLVEMAGAVPELSVLESRLKKIDSRIPSFRKIKSMTLKEFLIVLSREKDLITLDKITVQLEPVLKPDQLIAIDLKIKIALAKVIKELEGEGIAAGADRAFFFKTQ